MIQLDTIDLSSLNAIQREAVTWQDGPLLVLAGPGSGKTRVLTMHAAWLLRQTVGQRFRLLALTFTVKAASEMKQRLDKLLGDEKQRARVSTFHSFAAEILRQHGSHVGLSPNFEIIADDAERKILLRETLRGFTEDAVYEADEARLMGLLEIYTERGWNAADATKSLGDANLAIFIDKIATQYTRQLIERNMVDFPTLIGLTTKLLKTMSGVARQIHITYPHILVDEFQDTNPAQFALLSALVGPNANNLFVVGDDDQVIYQWNGANPRRIDELKRQFKTTTVQLPTNYRCPQEIVQLANNLISNNKLRTASKTPGVAHRQEKGEQVVFTQCFDDVISELSWIASNIKRRAITPEFVVLLCRSNRLAKMAVEQLTSQGVYCVQPKRNTKFDSAGVRFIVLASRAVNSPNNPEHLIRLAEVIFEMSGERPDIETANQRALERDTTPVRAFLEDLPTTEYGSIVPDLAKSTISNLLDGNSPKMFVENCLQTLQTFYDSPEGMAELGFEGFEEDAAIIRATTAAWARGYGQNQSIASFIQELQLAPKVAPIPQNAIQCLTIHTAKGLEFEHVYLFGMVDGQFPSFQAVKAGVDSNEMEEERRNCYVAVTRASATLTVTWASNYFGYSRSPSRFLTEMKVL